MIFRPPSMHSQSDNVTTSRRRFIGMELSPGSVHANGIRASSAAIRSRWSPVGRLRANTPIDSGAIPSPTQRLMVSSSRRDAACTDAERALFLARAGHVAYWKLHNAKASDLFGEYRQAAEEAPAACRFPPLPLHTVSHLWRKKENGGEKL